VKCTIPKTLSICIFVLSAGLFITNAGNYTINADGTDIGRAYEGIGAVSAGGNSRLLIDYNEPYRGYVLDYLFKPKFGAGFQHLKVEIGSGQNSTSGAVASHAYSDAEIANPVSRSYELWLMSEAKNRDPNIILDCLGWGFPECTDGYWTSDMAEYIASFVDLAKNQWGLDMDWVGGCVNEGGTNNTWLKNTLRPTLDSAGYSSVKIQSEEGHGNKTGWPLLTDCMSDPALDAVVDAVTYHYVEDSDDWPTAAQIAHGKPMWDSEQHVGGGDWDSAKDIVRTTIRDYIEGRITKHEIWCPIDSAADGIFLGSFGALQADEPWSGNFAQRPAMWGIAHFTQFTEPGWFFLNSGCGYLSGNGCYATLMNSATGDYSIIIYTENEENITVNLSGGLSTALVHQWKSRDSSLFFEGSSITPSAGSYSFTAPADRLISLTTTTGQQKGSHTSPAAGDLALPYADDFESYSAGDMPKYLSDYQGTFQIQNAKGGRSGLALQQMVPQLGYGWGTSPNRTMTVIPGPMSWDNYELNSDVYIEAGEIYLAVRKGNSSWAWEGLNCGYAFVLEKDGDWRLHFDDTEDSTNILNRGKIAGFNGNKWHNVKLRFIDDRLDAYVDGIAVCTVVNTQRSAGNACIGGTFDASQYDNLSVKPAGNNWDVINQSDSSVSYTGTWWYYAASWFMFGDCKYSSITNASATYPFYGRVGRVWGTLRDDCGYMDVYVDNIYQTTIDCYDSSGIYGTILYETNELDLDNHTIKAVVKGEKNPGSSDDTIILEAFSSTQSPVCSGPPTNLALPATASASSQWEADQSLVARSEYNGNSIKAPWGEVGYRFRTGDDEQTIDALGFIDIGNTPTSTDPYAGTDGDGLQSNVTVTLWDESSSTAVAQVVVPSGTGAELVDGFRYADISGGPVVLQVNTNYVISFNSGNILDQYLEANQSVTLNSHFVGTNDSSTWEIRWGATIGTMPTDTASWGLGRTYGCVNMKSSVSAYAAEQANDADNTTRWNSAAGDVDNSWLEMDFGSSKTFSSTRLTEFGDRIQNYKIQYYDGTWNDASTGSTIGNLISKTDIFGPVTGTKARLYIVNATTTPSIYEFEVYTEAGNVDLDGNGIIDMDDLAVFCNNWLKNQCTTCCDCAGADLYHNDKVDWRDYGIFSNELF